MMENLLRKLQSERRFYMLRKENLMDQLETRKIEVLDMEYRLNTLRKDLRRSEVIIDLLKENEF